MKLIVYISEYSGSEAEIDQVLESITLKAKTNNPEYDVTGVLFYQNGKFVQIIEGEEESLNKLMKRIESDSRHSNIKYLVNEEIQNHAFKDWNMDSFNLSDKKNIDAEELEKIYDAYRKVALLSSDTLVLAYKTLLEEGVFSKDL